jgi:copper(I)-binding protein
MIIRKLFLCITLIAIIQQSAFAEDIEVSDAWVREAPPTATVLAGYMSLTNTSDKQITLNSISSKICNRVEMHNTLIKNNVARMIKQDNVVIDAGKTVTFKPGGMHLMLIAPNTALHATDTVTFELEFSNHSKQTVTAEVRKVSGVDPHAHHHH